MMKAITVACATILFAACDGAESANKDDAVSGSAAISNSSFTAAPVAQFSEPWAMTFLPDGRLLVTEKRGRLRVYTVGGATATITGVPTVSTADKADCWTWSCIPDSRQTI